MACPRWHTNMWEEVEFETSIFFFIPTHALSRLWWTYCIRTLIRLLWMKILGPRTSPATQKRPLSHHGLKANRLNLPGTLLSLQMSSCWPERHPGISEGTNNWGTCASYLPYLLVQSDSLLKKVRFVQHDLFLKETILKPMAMVSSSGFTSRLPFSSCCPYLVSVRTWRVLHAYQIIGKHKYALLSRTKEF